MYNFTEFDKLVTELTNRGYEIEVKKLYDGKQVICGSWDAVIHGGSYGHRKGLLEVYGMEYLEHGEVEGFLTADDVLKRLDDSNHSKENEDGNVIDSIYAIGSMIAARD